TDPDVRRHRTRVTAAQFLAGGVDPKRSAVFCQSHVPEHTELAWVLASQTAMGEMNRMTQYKDKVARGLPASVGLFTYPVLMAADILLYDAAYVPVGEDQRQHLEITRDLAERVNWRFGEVLVVPEPYIVKESAKIMDLQDPTAKMSGSTSSDKGLVLLSDDAGRIARKIRSAVTDTGTEVRHDPEGKPGVSNLLVMHSVLSGRPVEEVAAEFDGHGYGGLKKAVAEVVVEAVGPFQRRMAELLDDPAELDRVLADGADRAGEVAAATMGRVREAVGLLRPLGDRPRVTGG
ncbi:MAG TPA: tryptophan--tRNA ligase, partial [Dermatophilaceae bacterium]|nr:tryptophan--tRNA ligase [Dermatophilaceae bacterium]